MSSDCGFGETILTIHSHSDMCGQARKRARGAIMCDVRMSAERDARAPEPQLQSRDDGLPWRRLGQASDRP